MLNLRNEQVLAFLERYVTRWTRLGHRRLAPGRGGRRAARGLRAARGGGAQGEPGRGLPLGARPRRRAALPGPPRRGPSSDFPTVNAVLDFFLRRSLGAEALADLLRRRGFFFGADRSGVLLFLADLDQPRPLTIAQDRRWCVAALFLFTCPATAAAPYGDEVGLKGDRAGQAFEQGLDRVPMSWDESRWDHRTLRLLRALHWLRSEAPVAGGAFHVVLGARPLLAWFARPAPARRDRRRRQRRRLAGRRPLRRDRRARGARGRRGLGPPRARRGGARAAAPAPSCAARSPAPRRPTPPPANCGAPTAPSAAAPPASPGPRATT
jgi:hypothetical protein